MSDPVLEAREIRKVYHDGTRELLVLDALQLSVAAGETVAILGRSGTGKSTLLHLLGLLDRPTAGDIYIDGDAVGTLSESQRTRLRAKHIGFVFQHYHLLPDFNALENTAVAGELVGSPNRTRAEELLTLVGLQDRLRHRPAKLSGGERQRVAIARALMNRPPLLLCDEPTGNLDPVTGNVVLNALLQAVEAQNAALILVTHDTQVASRAGRVFRLSDGQLHQE